ncbi:MAG: hypothetical protein NTU57_01795 [Candidatus Aenigmarchaeota archaeon]|nr:hypothetical protein [Candidatus Aenigmarchaeota archaeon]
MTNDTDVACWADREFAPDVLKKISLELGVELEYRFHCPDGHIYNAPGIGKFTPAQVAIMAKYGLHDTFFP